MSAPNVGADLATWGIAEGYHDVDGTWHVTPPDTAQAFLDAMGAGVRPGPAPTRTWVVRADEHVRADGVWELVTEDGGTVRVEGTLPPDVPLGYHRLTRLDDGHEIGLVVTPGRCHLPDRLRTWGFSVQLATLRSRSSWGMGDLGDLRELGRWSADDLGAGMLLVNPLHAPRPGLPQEPSPYSPSSRRYRNPLYLRVEEVPGFDGVRPELPSGPLVERDPIYTAKLAALERAWGRFTGDERFDRYRAAEGESLAGYATWCALVEDRRTERLPHPGSDATAAFRREREDRIAFHSWVQWLLDEQLARAGAEIDLVQDLAVGFDPSGADAWQYQDCLVASARIGAPPDEFNTAGQEWGLPPFDPWRLRAAGYEPFVRTVRAGLSHAGGLRVDHVMGLFRLFWVPLGGSPADGTYVRYPWRDLLGILALESHRAGAYVVGEDLGTVEDEVRDELAAADLLTYRLLWFEPVPPREYPARALAAVTTHDLPTVAGLWTGSDLDDQRRAGVTPNEESTAEVRARLQAQSGLHDDAGVDDVVTAAYALLAEAPSAILCATLEDALGVATRPNLPGTWGDARPNWSIALPATLEEIEGDPRPRRLAALLRRGED